MALFGKVNEEYTKTGKGMLSSFADKVSYVPFIGGALAWPIGMLGTIIESVQLLFQGKIGSSLTALAAGTVGNSVDALTSGSGPLGKVLGSGFTWWVGNAASGVATGATLGTHARALTESLIGGIGGALGAKPEVLNSYPAAIGSIGAGLPSQGRNDNFRDKIAAERGMTRAQMDARADQAYVNMAQSNNGLGA